MLVLELLQVQLVDLPEDQKLPVQEFHLLLDRLAVGKLCKRALVRGDRENATAQRARIDGNVSVAEQGENYRRRKQRLIQDESLA